MNDLQTATPADDTEPAAEPDAPVLQGLIQLGSGDAGTCTDDGSCD